MAAVMGVIVPIDIAVQEYHFHRFVVDTMLGKLARWLRAMGYDAVYYTYLTQERFFACGSCGKVYWQGSHFDRIVERLGRLLSTTGAREAIPDD